MKIPLLVQVRCFTQSILGVSHYCKAIFCRDHTTFPIFSTFTVDRTRDAVLSAFSGKASRGNASGSGDRFTATSSCLICISGSYLLVYRAIFLHIMHYYFHIILIFTLGLKQDDAIWSCSSCYDAFHLDHIERWAKDSIFQQKNEIEGDHGKHSWL